MLLDLIWPIGTVRPLVPLERLGDVYERGMTPPTRDITLNKCMHLSMFCMTVPLARVLDGVILLCPG